MKSVHNPREFRSDPMKVSFEILGAIEAQSRVMTPFKSLLRK